MRPLAVDLVLLRSTAPDLPLVVGRVLAARVVERHGRHGVINLAGAYLTAELPEELRPGDRLRLVVQEASGDRAVLALAQEPPSGPQVPPPLAQPTDAAADPLVILGDGGGSGEEGRSHVVTLRFEGEATGSVELRVALDEQLVHARVALPGGPALALARERVDALRSALATAAGRSAEVEIVARPRPLDVYG
ncbi:MAG TPA: hypothetical protein VFG31_06165 [Conexibacter sp.]|nr:hypothetical protein [Conexibacter sp.]